MKKIFITILAFLSFSICNGYCATQGQQQNAQSALQQEPEQEVDYEETYRLMQVPTFSYVHGYDPGQYYDCLRYTGVPYPLLRLSAPIYFKSVKILPGYYYLTPREYKGESYILVKEQGTVKYILPVYKKNFVPVGYYDAVLPKPKLTPWQKFQEHMYNTIGRMSKDSRRLPTPNYYLELQDVGNNFVSVVVYYKEFRYYTIVRTVQL
ncbi:hypothetical protein KBA27_06730 [bacterium]|nr:hypothetical protein [bacterium]